MIPERDRKSNKLYTYIRHQSSTDNFLGKKSQIKFFFSPAEVEDELIVHFGMTRFDSMARKIRAKRTGGYSIPSHGLRSSIYLELLESLSTASDSLMQRLYIVYSSIYLYNFRRSR